MRADAPPLPTGRIEAEILDVRILEPIEAKAIFASETERRFTPKVPIDASSKLRVRHHAIARLLAMGRKNSEIAEALGCSPTTIANLERTPAFQALLLEYMNEMDEAAVSAHARVAILRNMTTDELTERLGTTPDKFKVPELIELLKTTADRTGLGPKMTVENKLNGAISAADLRDLKAAPAVTVIAPASPSEIRGEMFAAAIQPESEVQSAAEVGSGVREESGTNGLPDDLVADVLSSLDEIRR